MNYKKLRTPYIVLQCLKIDFIIQTKHMHKTGSYSFFFQIIDPSINNVTENAMESSIHDGSKNPTQIQTRNDTETFTDLNTTGKSSINFLK